MDVGHPFHEYFPEKDYALRVPIVLLLVATCVLFTFLSLVMIKGGAVDGASPDGGGSGTVEEPLRSGGASFLTTTQDDSVSQ